MLLFISNSQEKASQKGKTDRISTGCVCYNFYLCYNFALVLHEKCTHFQPKGNALFFIYIISALKVFNF